MQKIANIDKTPPKNQNLSKESTQILEKPWFFFAKASIHSILNSYKVKTYLIITN